MNTTKKAFIQWKGTDVCMDLHCPKCGHHNHYDGMFGYAVECGECKVIWKMNNFVTFHAADANVEEDKYWIEHPLRDSSPTPADGKA